MTQVHVPKAWHSTIIGKSGSNLQYLKQTFGVSVAIPRSEDASTQITIDGERSADAIAFIEQKLGFTLSRIPLVEASYDLTPSESSNLFRGNILSQETKQYGLGVRVPRADGENLVVQGTQDSIDKAVHTWGGRLGKTLVKHTERPAAYEHKVEIHDTHVAETIFFGDGDLDDEHDLNRFIELLKSGNKTLDICVFTITCNRIAQAITSEHRSGVRVRLITDNHTADCLGSDIADLARAGIPVKIDVSEGHMHHKFCVIDNKLLMNGSFNWTRGASTVNYENVLATNDPTFVKDFTEQFETMWKDTKRFVPFK